MSISHLLLTHTQWTASDLRSLSQRGTHKRKPPWYASLHPFLLLGKNFSVVPSKTYNFIVHLDPITVIHSGHSSSNFPFSHLQHQIFPVDWIIPDIKQEANKPKSSKTWSPHTASNPFLVFFYLYSHCSTTTCFVKLQIKLALGKLMLNSQDSCYLPCWYHLTQFIAFFLKHLLPVASRIPLCWCTFHPPLLCWFLLNSVTVILWSALAFDLRTILFSIYTHFLEVLIQIHPNF